MAQTTYQVILSSDGKHTVIGTTDDQAMAEIVLDWAQDTYDWVVSKNGTKADLYQKANANGSSRESVPMCGIHHSPMALVKGRKGDFWSCHEKNPDGSWCSFRADAR